MPIEPIPTDGLITDILTVASGSAMLSEVPNISTLEISGFEKVFVPPGRGQFMPIAGATVLIFNILDNGATPTANYYAATSPGVTVDKVNEIISESNALEPLSPGALLTTKGDVLVFGADPTRLPIGSDGQVLIADSGETSGMKWADQTPISGIGFQKFSAVVLTDETLIPLTLAYPPLAILNVYVTKNSDGTMYPFPTEIVQLEDLETASVSNEIRAALNDTDVDFWVVGIGGETCDVHVQYLY